MLASARSTWQRSVSLARSSAHGLRKLRSTPVQLHNVSMASIKEIRKRTGAPIGAVKKALQEQSGDLDAAIDHLRKLGASMAAKKAHREASEGLIGIAISPDKNRAVIVEVNSETDFVARTPRFGELVSSISHSMLEEVHDDNTGILKSYDSEHILGLWDNKALLLDAVASLGENIVLKRASLMCMEGGTGAIFGYTHGSIGVGGGRIGVLVALKGTKFTDVGSRLAMHIAAAAPSYTNIDSIPSAELERERSVLMEAAQAEQKPGGKPRPPAVLERITSGRLNKWYSAEVLEEQEMLVEAPSFDGKPRSVKEHLKAESNAVVVGMCRMVVGGK